MLFRSGEDAGGGATGKTGTDDEAVAQGAARSNGEAVAQGAASTDRAAVSPIEVVARRRVPLVDRFPGPVVVVMPGPARQQPWYGVPPEMRQRGTPRRPSAPAVHDPIADLADGILPETPAGLRSFGGKITYKPKNHGGRPAKRRA